MTDAVLSQTDTEDLGQEDELLIQNDLKELGIEDPIKQGEPEDKSLKTEITPENDDDLHPSDGRTDEEREAIRARRRVERQQKKQNRREREDSYRREIDSLRAQLAEVNDWKNAVDRRHVDNGVQQIDAAIRDSQSSLDLARQALKEATISQDGEALVDAQELYYAARKRIEDLSRIKQRISQGANNPQPAPSDPAVVNMAQSWMKDKSWYDPSGKDIDSRIALQIDQTLAQEGWNPRTKEYWEELDNRLQKYLPHRFTNGTTSTYTEQHDVTQRRPPTSGSSQGAAPRQGEYRLSPERIRAIKEAGRWDDPEQRKKMIKSYMEYDRNRK